MLENLKTRTERPPRTVSRPELLRSGTDTDFRSLVHDLLAFSSRLQDIRGRFGAFVGLTGIQYTILISIRHLDDDEGVGVKAIASHLSLSSPFVTIETKKLIALGLLKKRTDAVDRRRVRLTVSEEGDQRLAQLLPLQRQVNDALFASLDAEGFAQLSALAGALKDDAGRALALAHYLAEAGEDG